MEVTADVIDIVINDAVEQGDEAVADLYKSTIIPRCCPQFNIMMIRQYYRPKRSSLFGDVLMVEQQSLRILL